MTIKLTRNGSVFETRTCPAYDVTRDGVKVATAHKEGGNYYAAGFSGSRARLLQHFAAVA